MGEKTYTSNFSLPDALPHPFAGSDPSFVSPDIDNDGKPNSSSCFPSPNTQPFIHDLQQPEVLIDTVTVARPLVENIEGSIEKKGELDKGIGGSDVRRKEGNVERIIL